MMGSTSQLKLQKKVFQFYFNFLVKQKNEGCSKIKGTDIDVEIDEIKLFIDGIDLNLEKIKINEGE